MVTAITLCAVIGILPNTVSATSQPTSYPECEGLSTTTCFQKVCAADVLAPLDTHALKPVDKPQPTPLGLPKPHEEAVTHFYDQLTTDFQTGCTAWLLLRGQRIAEKAGYTIVGGPWIPAWIWTETYPNLELDLYQYNCNDQASLSLVSVKCPTTNVQVAGFRAGERNKREAALKAFVRIYGPDEESLRQVLESVVERSFELSTRSEWAYIDVSAHNLHAVIDADGNIQESVGFDDLLQGGLNEYFDPRKQAVTFMLVKDPLIAAATNSIGVSLDDLFYETRHKAYAYGYFGPEHQQTLSDLAEALWRFDMAVSQ